MNITSILASIKTVAKSIAALISLLATALAALNLPAPWNLWIAIAAAVGGAVATWAIPNAPAAPAATPAAAVPPAPAK